jgi:cytoskeleton protein RodZ
MSDTAKNEVTDHEEQRHQPEEMVGNELSPGAQLSARRQALNWSIEDVASQLNLAPRQIQAIEMDNYAALPGMASVRGFIRSYAKLLGVDAAPLLQVVAKEATPAEEAVPLRRALPPIRFPENRLSSPSRRRLLPRTAFVMLLLGLLAGGLFVMQQNGMQSLLPTSLQFGTGNAPTVSIALGRVETVEKDKTTTGDAHAGPQQHTTGSAPNSSESGNAKKQDIAVIEAAATGVMLVAQPVAAGDAVVSPVGATSADTKDILMLKLHEDSWIEIKRSDNSTLVSALFKAGTTESFKITSPVAMTVGNAAGVDATLRGKPIELKADAKSNVARLTLK